MRRCGIPRIAKVLRVGAQWLFLLFAVTALRAAPVCSRFSGETWESLSENHRIGQTTALYLGGSMRTKCGFTSPNPYDGRGAIGFRWQPLKHLEIFPSYTFLAITPGPKTKQEVALEISAIDVPLGFLTMRDGNKFEEDFPSYSGTTTRYTNEVEISHQMSWDGFRFTPFLVEELKYDLHRRGWSYTRLEVGAGKRVSKKVSFRMYYVRQSGAHFSHSTYNAIGISFNTSF